MQREKFSRCIVLFLLVACCLILIFDTYDIIPGEIRINMEV